ncbi:hypothetical protein G7048_19150 [Diaphorobacter sp. HDW4B]|uniref:hypothetical protein n=1 Tax=Diaphorobacter sp. HDW4B TaxID=2714925 RepID=UPI00140BA8A7|nr:hypothetical protein [Diaphorobacter sp. HDW4B]QIL72284.1 hypothetical protein G7048_19150 [Diaphorobacter sp. HDW4B]
MSTDPVLDEIRHSEAMECAEAMQDARIKTLYDDTMDAVKRGDLSRIVETFSWDEENGRIAAAAMNAQALEALARIWANEHAKP